MDPLLVLVRVFAIFIPALMLPGPDFIAVVRSSMTRGTRAGLMTTLGVSLGLGTYATLGLLGLSAVMVRFEWLAWAVRIAGGAYLVCLGIRLLAARSDGLDVSAIDRTRPHNAFLFGFGVTLTNPKAIVLFASVFATSVTGATPVWLMGLMVGLVFASAMIWYSLVSLFMSSQPVMRSFGRLGHWIERVAGACFVVIGGRMMLDSRNPVTP